MTASALALACGCCVVMCVVGSALAVCLLRGGAREDLDAIDDAPSDVPALS